MQRPSPASPCHLVPELATQLSLLLNASLAVFAHDLSHIAGYDPFVAEIYHEQCVKLLIPSLDASHVSVQVVATTVLSRNLKQKSSAIMGINQETSQWYKCNHQL